MKINLENYKNKLTDKEYFRNLILEMNENDAFCGSFWELINIAKEACKIHDLATFKIIREKIKFQFYEDMIISLAEIQNPEFEDYILTFGKEDFILEVIYKKAVLASNQNVDNIYFNTVKRLVDKKIKPNSNMINEMIVTRDIKTFEYYLQNGIKIIPSSSLEKIVNNAYIELAKYVDYKKFDTDFLGKFVLDNAIKKGYHDIVNNIIKYGKIRITDLWETINSEILVYMMIINKKVYVDFCANKKTLYKILKSAIDDKLTTSYGLNKGVKDFVIKNKEILDDYINDNDKLWKPCAKRYNIMPKEFRDVIYNFVLVTKIYSMKIKMIIPKPIISIIINLFIKKY